MPEPIQIPFEGDAKDLIAETKKVQKEMDDLQNQLKGAGVSQSAYNKAVTDAKRAQEEHSKSVKQNTMSITDFRSAYQIAMDVVQVSQQVWNEVGQKWVDNAVEVGNLARSMGTTTEEASRLKEVADDVGISTDTLRTSLKIASKDGFEPTINSIAQMADEYTQLAPGVERNQFLMDRFGKSGEEMGKLLEKGGQSIRDMAAAMDDGMIVTEEAYEQARQYQMSVDALKDSWDALTYKAAPPLVKAVTGVINSMRDGIRANEILQEDGKRLASVYDKQSRAAMDQAAAEREAADAMLLAKKTAEDAGGAFEDEAEKAKRLEDEAKAAAEAIKAMTDANKEMLSTIGEITQQQDAYSDKVTELNTQHADLLAEKQALIDQGYSVEGEKITEVNGKIDENIAKQQELAEEFERSTRRRILAMLEEELAVDGLDAKETEYLLSKGIEWGIYSDSAVAALQEARAEVQRYKDDFNNIPTEKSVTVTTYFQQIGYDPQTSAGGYAYGHATGGTFTIPQSYGNEGFRMGGGDTASGGEKLTITPAGQDAIDYKKLSRAIVSAFAQAGG